MRKLILPLAAAAALAAPTSALAWGSHHGHHGKSHAGGVGVSFAVNAKAGSDQDNANDGHAQSNATFEKLSGTGTSFGGTTATATGSIVKSSDHPNGHFSVSLASTWPSATTKSFNGGSVSCAPATASVTLSNGTTSTTSYTGKTCSWTADGTTKYVFLGKASDGTRALLKEDGTTVTGAVIGGDEGLHFGILAGVHVGNCDHH